MRATIDDMFMRALELDDPRERERYLDSVCDGDSNLREQVDKLLAISPGLGSFLEVPAATPWSADTKPDSESVDLCGQTLGPYRLIRLAGKGGMGEVYLAEQQAPIQRQVAIKVIRSGLATAPMLARFAHESQLLGLMDHPNIARVLDAGTTSDGNPFIAMEWVEGVYVTTFCDQQRYTIRQRVELLVTICQAVQHAHQKGIIHRDLKPTNVLVTVKDGQAVPKIIDFGVARATQADRVEQERVTQAGQIIGTFEYMAPEQAESANADIDTRADVFALGALLYELLTGAAPIPKVDFRKAGIGERLRLIREVEPVRPSLRYSGLEDVASIAANRQTGVSHLSRLVAHELDWICLKCLEKDRARRYETTNALAQDLLRYLSDEPVLAGPPTMAYRFKKFAGRNRNLLAVASVLGFLLAGAAIVSTWQAIRLGHLHEQSQANLQAANSNLSLAISAVDQFCTKVSEDLRLKEQDLRPLRKELLSSAVDFHQQLVDLRSCSGAARIDLARSHVQLGKLLMEIESVEQAIASFRQAIEEYQALTGDPRTKQTTDLELADCFYNLAVILGRSSELTDAKLAADQAVEILLRLLEADPDWHRARSKLANVRTIQSTLALESKQFDQSEVFSRMAIDELGWLAKEMPDDPIILTNWAFAQSQLGSGMFHRKLSNWREAESLLLEALEKLKRALTLDRDSTYHDLRLAETLRDLGAICKVTGRNDEAVRYFTEGGEILDSLQQKEPTVRSHVIQLASMHIDLSRVHELNNHPADSRTCLETAIDLLEPLAGSLDAELSLAIANGRLGGLLSSEGELDEAEVKLNRAIDMAERVLQRSPDDRQLGSMYPVMLKKRAILRSKQGKLEDSLSDYDRAIKAESVAMRAPTRIARGQIRLQLGDHGQAMAEVRETLAEMPSGIPDHVWIFALKSAAELCAQCSAAADTDEELSDEEQIVLSEEYAAYAVSLLKQAIEKGFKDIDSLATIPELEPLREREDFKALGL